MFSRQERALLLQLSDHPGGGRPRAVAARSAGYERKLLWSIRRKAARSIDDWELFVAAARNDPRVVPRAPRAGPVPVYTEPFARLLRSLSGLFQRDRARPVAPTRPPGGA